MKMINFVALKHHTLRKESKMDITISLIKQKFDEYNQQMFGGKLPPLPIKLSNAKTFLGKCCFTTRRGWTGKVEYRDFFLRINTRFKLSEEELEDVIIHEMIHYYILYFKIQDTAPHGKIFQQIMNGINQKFGRHLSISHKSTPEEREQGVDKRVRYHVIAIVNFHDGRKGIKVLPRVLPSILKYYNTVLTNSQVSDIQLYMSCNVYFNRFPCSSAFNVFFKDENEFMPHLADAEKMGCDGKRITRNC